MFDRVFDGRYVPTILTAIVVGAGIVIAYW
jgi:general stress protein CsbA